LLSTEEMKQRLVRLNNLEHLHAMSRERIVGLEKENKELKQRIKELEDKNNDQHTKLEALSFQFEQIKNKLFGRKPLGITDDYGAYTNAFDEHQLCWAHPQRKLRDMAESREFGDRQKKPTLQTYRQFSQLYHVIQKKIGDNLSPYLKKKFLRVFTTIAASHTRDPVPLAKLKKSLQKNKKKYFTFLDHPDIPIDDNKAERALRHLVIKRKISFGSKTSRGAETTSILTSVILSLKWNDPDNWFKQYLALNA